MTCGFMWLATLQFELKLQKCIRMGITIFKIFIWGDISSDIPSEIMYSRYTVGNFVLRRRMSGAVKQNFRPYIRRYTSPNENFEYSYPPNACFHNNISQCCHFCICIWEVFSMHHLLWGVKGRNEYSYWDVFMKTSITFLFLNGFWSSLQ